MRFNAFSSIASFSTALRASSSRSRLVPPRAPRQLRSHEANPTFVRASSDISLHSLSPNEGSTKNRRRVGRGVGSKMGGHTTGRGHKGQKSRSGKRLPYVGFEGGQLPLYRRIPKRGFVNPMKRTYAPLNISRLQEWIRQGRIDPTQPITVRTIVKSNVIHGLGKHAGVKLLGAASPDLPMPKVDLRLNKFSTQAGAAITQAGGSCTAVYHNRLSMEQELRPHKYIGREITPARPVRRADILYYTDPAKYGYLADIKEQFFKERGYDPTARRSRITGQPFKDTRGLTPEQAAAADAALAKKRMDNILEIQKLRI